MVHYQTEQKRSEKSIAYAMEAAKGHFAKMYPDVPYDGKYILWLNFGLYWEYLCESIECKMHIFMENGDHIDITDLRARHLYPNRRWNTACMKNGRKLSDYGVILHFDSFDELNKIKRIMVYWTINGMTGKDDDEPYCICVNYNVAFEQQEGMRHYSIVSEEATMIALFDQTNEKDVDSIMSGIDEIAKGYDNVFVLSAKEDDEEFYQLRDVKGTISEENAFASWLRSPNSFNPNLNIEVFSASETITPQAVPEKIL